LKLVPDHCDSPLKAAFFEKVYDEKTWADVAVRRAEDFYSDAEWPTKEIRMKSASGPGSYLGYATQTSLKIIKDVIKKYNVSSMVDIPCGDANWIHDSYLTDTIPLYLGLDIVKKVIDVNNDRFSHHSNKHFQFWDAAHCELPKFQYGMNGELQSFDLIHIRDVIQHLSLDRCVKYFCNAFKSGAKVMVTTSYPDSGKNKNVQDGDWYANDLEKEPFSFPPGDSCVKTHPDHEGDSTCVYDLTKPWVNDFVSNKC
jgi:hypothetical protein